MSCVSVPELSDLTLLIYLDGEADLHTVAHLERCVCCREKAQRLARLQSRLTARLYRLFCAAPLELGEFHLGLLPRDQAAAVALHVGDCPHCRAEGEQLAGYLKELAPDLEYSPLERTRIWVAWAVDRARALRQSGVPALAPACAGVRGDAEGPSLYQAGEAQIVIEIQEDPEQPDRRVLLGLITGMEPTDWQAHLWQAAERVVTAPVDELGNFVLLNLAPGDYELILSGPHGEIHLQKLEIGKI